MVKLPAFNRMNAESVSAGVQKYYIDKQKEYSRLNYLKNKDKYKKAQRIRAKEYKEWFINIKNKLFCKECGEDRHWVLDFHHRDPNTKIGEVSQMATKTLSKSKVLEEIKKCDILCANCHRDLHYKETLDYSSSG